MAAHVKVHDLGLCLMRPRLNDGPVCDDSAAKNVVCKCGTIYANLTFTLFL